MNSLEKAKEALQQAQTHLDSVISDNSPYIIYKFERLQNLIESINLTQKRLDDERVELETLLNAQLCGTPEVKRIHIYSNIERVAEMFNKVIKIDDEKEKSFSVKGTYFFELG